LGTVARPMYTVQCKNKCKKKETNKQKNKYTEKQINI
jgi:hypothetical protein